MRIGLHLSTAGGVYKAAQQAADLELDCLQIFAGSPRMWKRTEITQTAAEQFRRIAQEARLDPVVIHAPYLVNLAAEDDELWRKSIDVMREQVATAHLLGACGVVMHPGSRGGRTINWGVERIAKALEEVLGDGTGDVKIILENTAGGGGHLGGTLSQLAAMLQITGGLPCAVCLDTAHAWASGYRIDDQRAVSRYLDRVDDLIGIQNVKVWHFNDIALPRGRKRDVHTHLGKGRIGRQGFASLVADTRMSNAAAIMETPKNSRWADRRNVLWLRRLTGSGHGPGLVDSNLPLC